MTNSNEQQSMTCPFCGKGEMKPKRVDHRVVLSDGNELVVRNVELEVCDCCGEVAISNAAAAEIERCVAEHTEQLTPSEVRSVREFFGVDQDTMSEALGLGTKTYHKWEKGSQVVSRSMGYYIRILREYPEAFEWLKKRSWRCESRSNRQRTKVIVRIAFPNLSHERLSTVPNHPRFNPAKLLVGSRQ